MTADQLATALGISRPWLFRLKRTFPAKCPTNFDDLDAWKAFLASTRTQAKVRQRPGAKTRKDDIELSDIARLTKARANKAEIDNEILLIELAATKRQVVRQEEVIAIVAQMATVVRGRLMKMKNDLPSALLGLDAPAIDKVVSEKMEQVLAPFRIPDDFFNSKGLV